MLKNKYTTIAVVKFGIISVDGNFTVWTSWSECSVTCAVGKQWRYRLCTQPTPQNGGADCVGDRSQMKTCQIADCPGSVKSIRVSKAVF